MPRRITASEIARIRANLAAKQDGACPVSGKALKDPVLDHCHKTGAVRATLDRWTNGVLGKIENWAGRSGYHDPVLFLRKVADYLEHHKEDRTGLIYPTFKTEEQKKENRNKRARVRRAAKKAEPNVKDFG